MDPDDVRRRWASRSGEYSPDYYAHYGSNEASELVRERLGRSVGTGAPVLELGCSSGRHLAHLHEHGYRDLHGIEINDAAFEVMGRDYPALANAGTFYPDAMQSVVPEFDDDRFAGVFTVETLQHVHPDDHWLVAEVARIAADRLITVEIEEPTHADPEGEVNFVDDGLPLYYRDWGAIFEAVGMVEVDARTVGADTLREFRHSGA